LLTPDESYRGFGYPRWPNGRPGAAVRLLLRPVDEQQMVFRRLGVSVSAWPDAFNDGAEDTVVTIV
jgi:hypothetical protein